MLPKVLHNRWLTPASTAVAPTPKRNLGLRRGRPVARAGREKTLSEMRLVQLKGLHRSIFQQIASRRARRGGVGENNLSETRLVQLKGLHRSIFQQIASRRFAQVDIPTGFLARGTSRRPAFRRVGSRASHTGRYLVRFRDGTPIELRL